MKVQTPKRYSRTRLYPKIEEGMKTQQLAAAIGHDSEKFCN